MANKSRKFQAYSNAFLAWWLEYPLKVAKKPAADAYDDAIQFLVKTEGMPTVEARLKLVKSAKLFGESETGRGKYCPNPATWLNQRRWDDNPEEWDGQSREPAPDPRGNIAAAEEWLETKEEQRDETQR